MNKKLLCVALAALSIEAVPVSGFCGDMGAIENKAGFEFSGSLLYLQPASSNLDYAILTSPLPVPTPNWAIQSIHTDYSPAFNLGAKYIFADAAHDIKLSWSHFKSNDAAAVQADPLQFVAPFFEVGPNAASIRQARGHTKFDYDALNLDVGQLINYAQNMPIRLFGGVSGARLKQELVSVFQNNTPSTVSIRSLNASKYSGVGPRIGVEGAFNVYHHVNLTGQLAGAVLVGKMQPNTHYQSSSPTLAGLGIGINNQGIRKSSTNEVVPELDAKLGLNYSFPFNNTAVFTLEAGYMGAVYVNALTNYNPSSVVSPSQLGTIAVATMIKTQSNFSVQGPYLTASVKL